jgi:hypothetical protein
MISADTTAFQKPTFRSFSRRPNFASTTERPAIWIRRNPLKRENINSVLAGRSEKILFGGGFGEQQSDSNRASFGCALRLSEGPTRRCDDPNVRCLRQDRTGLDLRPALPLPQGAVSLGVRSRSVLIGVEPSSLSLWRFRWWSRKFSFTNHCVFNSCRSQTSQSGGGGFPHRCGRPSPAGPRSGLI